MQSNRSSPIRVLAALGAALALVALAPLSACDRSPSSSPATKPESARRGTSTPGAKPGDHGRAGASGHDHAHGDGHDHAHGAGDEHDRMHGDGHHHGPTTELGEATVQGLTIRASRDGDLVPGGDAPIDVWITGGSAKVRTVRFWIGTRDGRGSVKARAELEHDNYHTHAEIPEPLPPGSQLWVEIELEGGEKVLASFDLKM